MINTISYDRRSFPRKKLQYPLNIDMHDSGLKFGQIIDISLEGMRVLCTANVKRGKEYELSFHLPRDIYGDDEVKFTGLSIWTRPGPRQGTQLSGFKLIHYWQRTNNHMALSSVISEYETFLHTL